MAKISGQGKRIILRDYVERAGAGTMLHIGCADGFICVVTPAEFGKHIEHWNKHYKGVYEDKAKAAIESLYQVYQAAKGTTYFEDGTIRMSYSMVKDQAAWQICADQKFKAANKFLERSADFIPFQFREVMDETNRITGGIAIVLKGPEHGQFWDREEYEKRLPKELKDGADL